MTNKERLEINNAKIEEITKTLAKKQVSPTDMLQQMVDQTNSCYRLFYDYPGTNLDFIVGLDTSNVTNMSDMFRECSSLVSVDVSKLNTDNVTSMSFMFDHCTNLPTLDLSGFDTSKVTTISYLVAYCKKLRDINFSNWNTRNVTSMGYMFYQCYQLQNLDLSSFDTSNVTNMSEMFHNCSALTTLDLSGWDISNVTNTADMFNGCTKLETIIGKLSITNMTSYGSMFYNCKALTNVTLFDVKKSITLGSGTSYGTLLSNTTLINTIQQLWDNTDNALGGTRTLTLSTTSKENIANIYVKLITPTQEQIDADPYINEKKPCVVCEPTDEGAMTLTEYATTQKNWTIA